MKCLTVILTIYFIAFANLAIAQSTVDSLLRIGNEFYKKKEFQKAAELWEKAAIISDNKLTKNTNYSYAAFAFASGHDSVNSFRCLEIAIKELGFNDLPAIQSETAFEFMKTSSKWKELISLIKPVYTKDPKSVKIIDTDVINFWKAYDIVQNSPTAAESIYKEAYFKPGSLALQFYYINKIETAKNFVYIHELKKKYYASIRSNTLKAAQLKQVFEKSFKKLKNIYPEAIFPPVYFVIGKLNSAGTVSSDGLILAIDQASMSTTADTSELNQWEKRNISANKNLPHTVAHELIHYEQDGLSSDNSLLAAAIKEGMADFIGELISGKTANERLKLYAKGKEKIIWSSFKKEMYLDNVSNWIANSDQETTDKPADLGYWVGYQICRAYYEQSLDKKKAIHEMLHIKNYKSFLEQSKLSSKFE